MRSNILLNPVVLDDVICLLEYTKNVLNLMYEASVTRENHTAAFADMVRLLAKEKADELAEMVQVLKEEIEPIGLKLVSGKAD